LSSESVFVFFGDDIDVDLSVTEAVGCVVVLFESALETPFTAGVAPGIDDNVTPVEAVVGDDGTSGSLGKLSVYNILAGLLHRTNQCN
jgi:hypothetical protein